MKLTQRQDWAVVCRGFTLPHLSGGSRENKMYPSHFYLQQRAMSRRYAQLQQLIIYLALEPGRHITVLVPHKEGKKEFLDFAERNGVIFETGRLVKWGNLWKYRVKSFKWTRTEEE